MTHAPATSPRPASAPSSTASATPQRRLDWLEVGRGLAAFGVVISHFEPWRDPVTQPVLSVLRQFGGWGVEFFFVLSGFIILYVHARDLGTPAALPRYAWRRVVRIFPTYWAVLALSLLVNQTVQIAWARQVLTPGYVLDQVLLQPGALMIGQAWTLRHELLFYGVFSLLVVNRRLGLAVFGAWMAVALGNLAYNGLPPGQVNDGVGIVIHHYNLDFAIGMGIALATWRERLGRALAIAAGVAVVLWVLAAVQPGVDAWRTLAMKALFGTIVTGAVIASRRGIAAPRVLIGLGAMSYALYISHELSGTAVGGALRRAHLLDWPVATMMLRIAAALVGGWLIYRWFERPVLRRLHGLRFPTFGRRGDGATAGSEEGPRTAPPTDHSVSSNVTALAPVADSRTWSPSTSATSPSEMK